MSWLSHNTHMEEWRDQGIVLAVRPHAENGAVLSLLTEEHGRHAGYVHGGQSSKMRGILEPGNLVSVAWGARIADNLGAFTMIEQERHVTAGLMGDPLKLGVLLAACSLCDAALPEREGHAGLFYGLLALLESMDNELWGVVYVMWELALLRELGFGLELSKCAGGGDSERLAWVSPKSGQAVSEEAGAPYKGKLLPLPNFLKSQKGEVTDQEILKGVELTGYFLKHRVFIQDSRGIPEDRLRFEERFAKYVDRQEREDLEESIKQDVKG